MTIIPIFSGKAPGDNLDFSMDFSKILKRKEIITGATVTGTPSGLTISTPSISKSIVTAFVSGGMVETSYTLRYTITTNQGRNETRSAILNCLNL